VTLPLTPLLSLSFQIELFESRGFGFVTMASRAAALEAVEKIRRGVAFKSIKFATPAPAVAVDFERVALEVEAQGSLALLCPQSHVERVEQYMRCRYEAQLLSLSGKAAHGAVGISLSLPPSLSSAFVCLW
jgi:hypothetical protein